MCGMGERGAFIAVVPPTKQAHTRHPPASLTPPPPWPDSHKLSTIDLLKVDVEGSEEAVLRGIRAEHWPRIQQLVLEVENFAAVASIRAALERRGFTVSSYATEREKNPTATSEVSMMYASRPGYVPPGGEARGAQSEGHAAEGGTRVKRGAQRGRSASAAARKKPAGRRGASKKRE